ncbi:lantibiotic dehydratase [Rossellomorea vietnamensis]|uniref:Lantibiotic dehydratase n=1 Tax=Rossellomorea vietnamensis TaxID=218284 RepID=A0ACD4CCV9_9BACI|nr:lantibiotic dehydratase [Rossellomorea vietnamensis]UXH46428.1 lantibiotic dehydratase [Rossellomorea vietnamensis]
MNLKKNEKTKTTFKHFDFFMTRTSKIPFRLYEEINSELNDDPESNFQKIFLYLDQYKMKEFFLEALEVSSSSLSTFVNHFNKKSIKQKTQIVESLMNYLNRMSSRSTPFGLMSSVGFGEFGNEVSYTHMSSYNKEIDVDSQWLQLFNKELVYNHEILEKLKVKVNPSLFIKEGKVYVLAPNKEMNGKFSENYIKQDKLVMFLYEKFKELTLLSEVIKIVNDEFESIHKEQVEVFILKLYKWSFFISEVDSYYFSMRQSNYTEHEKSLITESKQFNELKEIHKLLDEYEAMKLGSGRHALKHIGGRLKEKYPINLPFAVNLYEQQKTGNLPPEVGAEIEEVAEVLYQLSRKDESFNQIESYRELFIKEYGVRREIPLKELLDEDLGIGSPYKVRQKLFANTDKKEAILFNELKHLTSNKQAELILTDDLIHKLTYNKENKNKPNSLELYFEYIKETILPGKDKSYSIILGPNVGSRGAGKTFSRFNSFYHRLNEKFDERIFSELRRRTDEEIIYAEIDYIPINSKSINVLPKTSPFHYYIAINSCRSNDFHIIDLDDLLVGVEKNSFYLKSKKLNKQVIPVKNHMLSHKSFPDIARFLCDLEYENQNNWTPFNWGRLESLNSLPRVRYKNTILYSARWLFNLSLINLDRLDSFESFIKKFKEWKELNKVPTYIHLGTTSNRLVFNLDNLRDLQKIHVEAKRLKENASLVMVESNENFKGNNSDGYSQEIVLPLMSNDRYKSSVSQQNLMMVPDEKVHYFPGEIWTSLRIYMSGTIQDDFIKGRLKSWIQELYSKGVIDTWYFLKYSDPRKHIRLRIKTVSEEATEQIIFYLLQKLRLLNKSFVNNIVIDTYEPETQKYGGRYLLNYAEKWFKADSESIMYWLDSRLESGSIWSKIDIAVMSIYDIINTFHLPHNVVVSWIDSIVPYQSNLEEFRDRKTVYMKSFICSRSEIEMNLDVLPAFIGVGLESRRHALCSYIKEISSTNSRNEILVDPYQIMGELIHMNLNRLFGPDQKKEVRVLGVVRHLMKNLENKRKFNYEI